MTDDRVRQLVKLLKDFGVKSAGYRHTGSRGRVLQVTMSPDDAKRVLITIHRLTELERSLPGAKPRRRWYAPWRRR